MEGACAVVPVSPKGFGAALNEGGPPKGEIDAGDCPKGAAEPPKPVVVCAEPKPMGLVIVPNGVDVADAPNTGVDVEDAPNAGVDVEDAPNAGADVTDAPNAGVDVADDPNAGVDVADAPNTGVDVADDPNAGVDETDVPNACVLGAVPNPKVVFELPNALPAVFPTAGEALNEDGPSKGEEPAVLLPPNPPPNATGDAPKLLTGDAPKPKEGGATGATPKPGAGGAAPNPPNWVDDGFGGGEPNGEMLEGADPSPPKPDMLKAGEHL